MLYGTDSIAGEHVSTAYHGGGGACDGAQLWLQYSAAWSHHDWLPPDAGEGEREREGGQYGGVNQAMILLTLAGRPGSSEG